MLQYNNKIKFTIKNKPTIKKTQESSNKQQQYNFTSVSCLSPVHIRSHSKNWKDELSVKQYIYTYYYILLSK